MYRAMHRSEYFHTCRKKVQQCLQNEKQPENRICIDHQPTEHHPDRLSRDNPPKKFGWNRSCRPESCGLVFIGAEHAHQSMFWTSPGYCKVLFNLEPPGLYPVKDQIHRFIERADFVLTSSSPADFSHPDKVFPFLYGSTWIQPGHTMVHLKSKMVSIIASGKTTLVGHKLRHELVQKHRDAFDIYGHGYNPVELKETALADYRYSVVIENTQEEYWFTEKIIDAFLTGTIPIYWGGPVASKLFNERGIKRFSGESDFARILSECTERYYMENLDAVRENFELALMFRSPEMVLEEHLLKQLGLVNE